MATRISNRRRVFNINKENWHGLGMAFVVGLILFSEILVDYLCS
jgi:hypothetical protein